MAELWLVCEGHSGSCDTAVLRDVFAQVLPSGISVEPAWGSRPNVVAAYLQQRRGGRAAHLFDRDYLPRASAEAALAHPRGGFLWRRHCIENYLLPPRVILRAVRQLHQTFLQQRGRAPSWWTRAPAGEDEIARDLTACANERAAEEACRLANYRLWAGLPQAIGHVQKRNPPRPTTTAGPLLPADWREALCQEAERVGRTATATGTHPGFARPAVAALFDQAYAELAAADYIGRMEFLVDFHGKDLLKDYLGRLRARGLPVSNDRWTSELVTAAVEEYRSNRAVYGTDDFLDLANAVRLWAGLPPLPPG